MIRRVMSVIAAFSLVFVPSAAQANDPVCSSTPTGVQHEVNKQIGQLPEAMQEVIKYGWNC